MSDPVKMIRKAVLKRTLSSVGKGALVFLGLCVCAFGAALEGGSLHVPAVASNRVVVISLDAPEGATQFRLSTDPEFREGTNGIMVQISNLDPNLNFVEVDITYPGGRPGGRGFPAGLPKETRDLRILLVRARLSDGGEFPAFATTEFFEEMMFGEKGFGAREVPNSVKAYWEQTTHGRVRFNGAVFPEVVTLGGTTNYVHLEPIWEVPECLVRDAVAAAKGARPDFAISGRFDFVAVLMPGDLSAVYNSTYEQLSSRWNDPDGNFGGYLIMDFPVDKMSKYFGPIYGEKNTSIDETHVPTKHLNHYVAGVWLAMDVERRGTNYVQRHDLLWYDQPITLDIALPEANTEVLVDYSAGFLRETNVSLSATSVDTQNAVTQVQGVWLASDTNRTGTNFFEGGTYTHRDNHITLGKALPEERTPVLIDYVGGALYAVYDGKAPMGSVAHIAGWYGTFIHELAHGFGPHISFTPASNLGDLYQRFDQIWQFSLMAGGNHNSVNGAFNVSWEEPAYLDGYSKYALGLLLPYAVRFGENETALRIYASEEYPHTDRTKLVKVPLHPEGVRGRRRLGDRDFHGEEYLLLELRKKGPVAGVYNFDAGLPHEGLLIYHVIERNPFIVGAFWENQVQIIDATPEVPVEWFYTIPRREREQYSFDLSPVPFGSQSGVYSYVHGASWQDVTGAGLHYDLERFGEQTIYAQFRDDSTNESGVISANVSYLAGGADDDHDGLPNSWEENYFPNTEVNGQDDADGDRFSNREEYVAGTDPLDASSFARIAISAETFLRLTYRGRPQTIGNVEFTTSLERPRWYPLSVLAVEIPESGLLEMYDWVGTGGRTRYYRLRLEE